MASQSGNQLAIKVFAETLAAATGRYVAVEIRGRQAYTDGDKIVLPAEGKWATSLPVQMAVATHELAHIWFETPQHVTALLAGRPAEKAARERDAWNAVVDVADETRCSQAMPPAEAMFVAAHTHALDLAVREGTLPMSPAGPVGEKSLLMAVILWARSRPGSPIRDLLMAWETEVPGFLEAASLVAWAWDDGRVGPRWPARTPEEWAGLEQVVARLVALLERLYPPAPSPSPPPSPPDRPETPPGATGGGQNQAGPPGAAGGGPDQAVPFGPGSNGIPGPDGAAGEPGATHPFIQAWQKAQAMMAVVGAKPQFHQECYDAVYPAFRSAARALADGPILVRQEGHRTGRRLSRPHRAVLDGRGFRRRVWEDASSTAVALVFDHSGSMGGSLPVFLPVGAALADALSLDPATEIALWRFGQEVERVKDTEALKDIKVMGGTATHLALPKAGAWLNGRTARRRVLVLFTDGKPDRVERTAAEVIGLRRRGIEVLVGSSGLTEAECARSMPGARVFDVDPEKAAASLHAVLRRLRVRT